MEQSMSLNVRIADADDITTLLEFYREQGYPIEVNPVDTFYMAHDDDAVIGGVRLSQEFGVTVLRGLLVAPAYNRKGVGTQLLRVVEGDLADKDCYAVPYAHLIDFFGQVGFRELDQADA